MNKIFTLKPLAYEYDALEPFIDELTVKIHHDKHQQAYVNNLNKTIERYPILFDYSLEKLLTNSNKLPESIKQAVINNAGGIYNHEFYWDGMGIDRGTHPTGNLKLAIDLKFGSYISFITKLKEVALNHFGSGWAWLVINKNKELEIISTVNQNNPISSDQIPLLAIDIWEHAYYLKYQNRRANYLTNIFNLINWNIISDRFNKLK